MRYIKSNKCVACSSERYKEWSAKNKQLLREKDRAWYRANKGRARTSNSAWQKKNAEKIRDKARQRYTADPEHVSAVNKKWRDSDKGKETIRLYEKKRYRRVQLAQYGLTVEQYEEMLTAQNGVCAICSALPGKRKLAVDHCHTTGRVRGLLCGPCNMGLGLFKDKPEVLTNAVMYLQKDGEAK